MKLARGALLATHLFIATGAHAGTADLSITASLHPLPPHLPRQSFAVTLTATNAGPDTSGVAHANPPIPLTEVFATVRVDENGLLPIAFTIALPSPCRFEEVPLDPGPGSARASSTSSISRPSRPDNR